MREKIRLPADVEIATNLLSGTSTQELTGPTYLTIDSVPNGKFNRVTKITLTMPELGEVIVIVPKERK